MPDISPAQYTLNAGIYGPKLAEREDTEAYYAAVRDLLNMRPLPEGGPEARGGFAHYQALRGPLAEIDLTNVIFTVAAGATAPGAGTTAPDPSGDEPDPPSYPAPSVGDPYEPVWRDDRIEP